MQAQPVTLIPKPLKVASWHLFDLDTATNLVINPDCRNARQHSVQDVRTSKIFGALAQLGEQ